MSDARVEAEAERVTAEVLRFLQRWKDPLTETRREDFAQEAAWTSIRLLPRLRDPSRVGAVARTVARRLRAHAFAEEKRLREAREQRARSWWVHGSHRTSTVREDEQSFRLRGVPVERAWVVEQLPQALAGLAPHHRAMLVGFYDGTAPAELARSAGIRVDLVKSRLHRSRNQLRKILEQEARRAGLLDP